MSPNHAQALEAEELDLKQLLAALRRRWPFILAGIALGGLAASWISARTKPTWEGSFEIVLASKNQGDSFGGALSANPLLANLASLKGSGGGGHAELETEVKILKSAYILKPVFDELRARKASMGEDMTGNSVKSWASNLTLQLQKGTSVLSIRYRDTTKSLILPVLRSVSDIYQEYSTRERNQSLKNALKFAEEQAKIYRKRSDASFRALNSFGLTYGIASKTAGSGGGSGSGIDVSKLLSSSNTSGAALNLTESGSSSISPNGSDPLAQLAQLNQELIRQQQIFTKNDPTIIALKQERDAVRRYIESSAFGSIAYPGKQAITKEQAQSILIRHKELERQANRDQSTLNSMEAALLSLQLEQARASTPWQLISNPTLRNRPVAPRTTRNLAIGLASGAILGCVAALFADKRSGRIFNKEQLRDLLPSQLLLQLQSDQPHTWNNGLHLLGLRNAQGGRIAILPLGEVQRSQINKISDTLKQTCDSIEICYTTLEATKFDKLLLVVSPGSIKRLHLDRLIQELGLQGTPIIGWIWLD